jgi:hypothetical protein
VLLFAQYYDSGSSDAALVIFLIVLLGLGFIPASIANSKGYTAVGFYFFGLFFFLPALIVVLILPNKKVAVAASPLPRGPDPIRHTPTMMSSAPPPGPGVVRECPFCKEAMRRDALVCPHCRRESKAWNYREGRWWATNDAEENVWFDEVVHVWRDKDELALTGQRLETIQDVYDLIIIESGPDPNGVARTIAEETGEEPQNIVALFDHLPTVVVSRIGFATAEGLRIAIAKKGAVVEIRKLN